MRWLFITYTLPSEPSKARVAVWRKLRKLGAINHQALWILPYSRQRIKDVTSLIVEIELQRGQGLVVVGALLDKAREEHVREAFSRSRDEEYHELIAKCDDYAKEIEFEVGRKNFIFAEVEENEEELRKLTEWLTKIERRDVMDASLHRKAVEKVARCEKLFDEFSKMVYEHVDHAHAPLPPRRGRSNRRRSAVPS